MSMFLKSGNSYTISPNGAVEWSDQLPAGFYIIKYNDQKNQFYLEIADGFTIPNKLYGDAQKRSDRIINTFLGRTHSTGVLLVGSKGSGKTLLSKLISNKLLNMNIPTIICNTAYHGDTFNKFISDINQPVCIIFDEFEKVYKELDGMQEKLLTLFDGVFSNKKLFIFTANNKRSIDICLVNRPGRIYYYFEYGSISLDFIKEYCNDNLIMKSETEMVCKLANTFQSFNFDMLKTLVEEMNRYSETAFEAVKYLNIKHEFDYTQSQYDVLSVEINGNLLNDSQYNKIAKVSPLNPDHEWYVDITDASVEGFDLSVKDIIHYDSLRDEITYKKTDDNHVCVVKIKKQKPTSFSVFNAL